MTHFWSKNGSFLDTLFERFKAGFGAFWLKKGVQNGVQNGSKKGPKRVQKGSFLDTLFEQFKRPYQGKTVFFEGPK